MIRRLPAMFALPALLAAASPMAAGAQIIVPGDPHAGDPAGIVADPCPVRPLPADAAGWQMWNLHMMTRDYGQLCRYRAANAALKASGEATRIIFFGDSITDNWIGADRSLFTDGIVDRGIGGQTTSQMLVRFRQDVLALRPRLVHILAGTNDIAGITGATTLEAVQDNIRTMVELARAHRIGVVLGAILPADGYPWAPAQRPAGAIRAMNVWLRGYARENGLPFVDYHAAMATAEGGMKPGLADDGVHPTAAGYAIMRPLALAGIRQAGGGR